MAQWYDKKGPQYKAQEPIKINIKGANKNVDYTTISGQNCDGKLQWRM